MHSIREAFGEGKRRTRSQRLVNVLSRRNFVVYLTILPTSCAFIVRFQSFDLHSDAGDVGFNDEPKDRHLLGDATFTG